MPCPSTTRWRANTAAWPRRSSPRGVNLGPGAPTSSSPRRHARTMPCCGLATSATFADSRAWSRYISRRAEYRTDRRRDPSASDQVEQHFLAARDGRRDQAAEQRVRPRRARLELRVRLRPHVVGVHVARELDHLDEPT